MSKATNQQRFKDACARWDAGFYEEAFSIFLEVAKAGDVDSQVNLGYFFDTGIGTEQNHSQALYWYRRAARRGSGSAANNIGTLYRDEGRFRLALCWFEKAVALGNEDSLLDIAKLYMGPLQRPDKAGETLSRLLASDQVTEHSWEEAVQLQKQLKSES